ncbi:MAG TPA: tripartite tricarboxylate transporter TctB family protein [Usitatibacter sp.]|nr:tripartite tricarboxylate transporter TctB family protein [Usitatibacter sp.]
MNDRHLLKGLFLIAVSLAFGLGSFKYQMGHFERAGPGLFPLLVSSVLFLIGAAIVVRSYFDEKEPMYFNLKNIALILGSLVGFALASLYINMIVGILLLVFLSTVAGTSYSVWRNVKIAAVLIAIAFAFKDGLGLQLPLY